MIYAEKSITLDATQVVLVDKPLGWSSFDVVKKLRGLFSVKKIGHAGTLDPLATGLLLLCMGKGTKRLAQYQNFDKTYEAEIVLGKTTPSFDLETPFAHITSYAHVQVDDIIAVAKSFIGLQTQKPPSYSACKIDGVRAYKKARNGKEVTLPTRQVTITALEITAIDLPVVRFTVNCSKGTYIRSLANDFGQKLGVGAYLAALRRTRIGPYKIEDAYTIPFLEKKKAEGLLAFEA